MNRIMKNIKKWWFGKAVHVNRLLNGFEKSEDISDLTRGEIFILSIVLMVFIFLPGILTFLKNSCGL